MKIPMKTAPSGGVRAVVRQVQPHKPTHVFKNFHGHPTKNRVVQQAKPNVGVYSWIPNQNVMHRTQPHERGSFFQNIGRSGTGSVGVPFWTPQTGSSNAEAMAGAGTTMMPGVGAGAAGSYAAGSNARFKYGFRGGIFI
jgi:hypothetical protein